MLRKELYNIKGQSLRLLRKLFTKQFNEHFYKSYFAEGFDTFFGYYDVNPVNLDESICLFSRVKKNSKKMEVGFNFLNDEGKDSIIIGNTELWCWQMGCRLQWLPNNKDKIVYNTILADNYGHLITDLNGKIIDKQQIPVYSISNSGEKFTTLNFSRLEKFRPGYGYNNITDNDLEIHAPKNDGIFISKIFSSETDL